jgi:hypothetical protein
MVDRLRTYRRWRSRKLRLLLPVSIAALALQLWLGAGSDAPAWGRVVSMGASGLILALLGTLMVQTLRCSKHHGGGDRAAARLLREQLAPSGRAALAAAVLLVVLGVAPYLVPSIPERAPLASSARRLPSRLRLHAPVEASEPAPEPPLFPAPPELPLAALPSPQIQPIAEKLPIHLDLEDAEPIPDLSASLLPEFPQEPSNGERPDGFPGYRQSGNDGWTFTFESTAVSFARMGVPREGHPEEWLPPEMRLEVSFLGRASELSFFLDVPIGRDESIRTSVSVGKLERDDVLESSNVENWERVMIAYSRRLAGHTLHAMVDLSVSIGVSVDRYQLDGRDGPLDPAARLSPTVSVDAALWQQSSSGLILHAGYSVPVNVTGASSGVLDLSASLRIDLSERISIHAGYRLLFLRLRDFNESLLSGEATAAFSDRFAGPIVGIDFRF